MSPPLICHSCGRLHHPASNPGRTRNRRCQPDSLWAAEKRNNSSSSSRHRFLGLFRRPVTTRSNSSMGWPPQGVALTSDVHLEDHQHHSSRPVRRLQQRPSRTNEGRPEKGRRCAPGAIGGAGQGRDQATRLFGRRGQHRHESLERKTVPGFAVANVSAPRPLPSERSDCGRERDAAAARGGGRGAAAAARCDGGPLWPGSADAGFLALRLCGVTDDATRHL